MTEPNSIQSAVEALTTPDHVLKAETAQWASANLAQHDRVAADEQSHFAIEDWKRCAARGIQGLLVDKAFGGQGHDLPSALLVLEGLGLGCRDNGLCYALASQIVSTQVAIEEFGSPAQQQRWLPGMVAGDLIGAFAITEPDAGSDATNLQTRAEEQPDGSWVLNGHKAFITLAPLADVVVVFAATKPDAGTWGISAFVVPTDTPGVARLANRPKMGMRTTPFGDITLTDVALPADALLGRAGAGFAIFNHAMSTERAFITIAQLGAMERTLDQAIAFASSREQGGAPIGDRPAVAHRIADMKMRHELARTMLYKAALEVCQGNGSAMTTAIAKLHVSEAAAASGLDAVRVHGARGYASEFEIERELRDSVSGVIYAGTSDIQRNIIARLLGLGSK